MDDVIRIARRGAALVAAGLREILIDLREASGMRITFAVSVIVGSAAVVAPFTPIGVPLLIKPLLGLWGMLGVGAGVALLVGEVGRVRRERRLRAWLDERATERLREQVRGDANGRPIP